MLPGYRRSRVILRFPWPRQETVYSNTPLPLAVRPVQEKEPVAPAMPAPSLAVGHSTKVIYQQPRGYA